MLLELNVIYLGWFNVWIRERFYEEILCACNYTLEINRIYFDVVLIGILDSDSYLWQFQSKNR